ncbi:hypothetical protein DFH11DRAFT_1603074 [Phellopilus nigrolimitatus]|nr:hypothetical protein DFH11DRAFT_1603074 [Phellopilus nigrolimitatus]
MPLFKKFGVWVKYDVLKSKEYAVRELEDEFQDLNRITAWIPCEADEEFAILVQIPPSDNPVCIKIFMDGVNVVDHFQYESKSSQFVPFTGTSKSNSTTSRVFKFAEILPVVSSDASNIASLPAEDDVGTIRVEIGLYNSVYSVESECEEVDEDACEVLDTGKPSHSDAKESGLITHRIGVSDRTVEEEDTVCQVEGEPEHYATFIFFYRSKEFLIAQGIIPLPKSQLKKRKQSVLNLENAETHHSGSNMVIKTEENEDSNEAAAHVNVKEEDNDHAGLQQGGANPDTIIQLQERQAGILFRQKKIRQEQQEAERELTELQAQIEKVTRTKDSTNVKVELERDETRARKMRRVGGRASTAKAKKVIDLTPKDSN